MKAVGSTGRHHQALADSAIETLEKWVRALKIPRYQIFNDGDKPSRVPLLPKKILDDGTAWGHSGKDKALSGPRESCLKIIESVHPHFKLCSPSSELI